MKNKIIIASALITMSLFCSNVSKAAFPIKADLATKVAQNHATLPNESVISNSQTMNENDLVKANYVVTKTTPGKSIAITKGLYILLAIIGLGFLAMGINDNFQGTDWIIGFILDCLFWLPGVIWALIKMSKYY